MKLSDYTKANRKAWNESAQHHRSGERWDSLVDGFRSPEFSTLDDVITAQLIEMGVAGKSLVQVACNNGQETLSACSLGATGCLGIDQSEEFVQTANDLNAIARRDCEFMCADIYALPEGFDRTFDIALITIGVINWMPDLQAFFDAVVRLIKPGGSLLIYETHPILEMFDPFSKDPLLPAFSYFTKKPYVETSPIVYDGGQHDPVSPSYWFVHTLGEVITGCVNSGLSVEKLLEFPHSNREVDFDIYEKQPAQLPMCFVLRVTAANV